LLVVYVCVLVAVSVVDVVVDVVARSHDCDAAV
jgi:hypothetical protein